MALGKDTKRDHELTRHRTCGYFSQVLFVVSSFTQNTTTDNIMQLFYVK